MDGVAAAWAAWSVLGDVGVEYIPAQYGQEPPDVKDCEVYILDFSYKRETLLEMANSAKSILVLDHHKTAQADLEGIKFAMFDMNQSGAMLAWKYFSGDVHIPDKIKLVQDRDLWQFKLADTRAFNAGARLIMDDMVPSEFNKVDVHEAIVTGELLIKQSEQQMLGHFEHRHDIIINGIKGLACNAPAYHSSELGNILAKESGTYGLVYSYSGKTKLMHHSINSSTLNL